MIISNLKKEISRNETIISIKIEGENNYPNKLWFSTQNEYGEGICDNQYDAFLVGLLYTAMRYGEDIVIKGKVSRKLYFNIKNYVIPLILSFSKHTKPINITADELTSENSFGKHVGTGFSGGVDSFCTIYDHLEKEGIDEYKIDSFLFLNVGAHGSKDEQLAKAKFHTRYDFLKKFPDELGLPFIPVDSNLHLFHPWGHQLTCTLTMVSGILVLQNFFSKYYCASLGWNYLDLYKYIESDLNKDIAVFDPVLLPLLSTEKIDLISDGTQYNRTEKTLRILNYEPVKRYLNVCVSTDETFENCSVCSKCSRTIMTIKSAGKESEFNDLFNFNKYRKIEKKYLSSQILASNSNPFSRYNVEYARKMNYKLPNYITAHMYNLFYIFKRIIRKVFRRRIK